MYGVSLFVPNVLEDKLVRFLIQAGKSLPYAYSAVRISDLMPGGTMVYCLENKVFNAGGPGPQTCDGFLNCLQWYLKETGRLVVPKAGPLPTVPVPQEIEMVTVPGVPPGVTPSGPPEWLQWVEIVLQLFPEIPPPETPMVRADGLPGPPDEWLEWMNAVVRLHPEMPLPRMPPPGAEPIPSPVPEFPMVPAPPPPGMVLVPGVTPGPPPEWLEWIETVAALVPGIPPPETPLVRADGLPGPADEWLEWMRAVAPLVPHIPPPEPIPPAGPSPAEVPMVPVPGAAPGPVTARKGLVLVVVGAGLLAAIFLTRSG
ncbi:hypothetical protein ES702_03204 [subsurface metagenome]